MSFMSLQRAAALSCILHVMIFVLFLIITRKPAVIAPRIHTVKLVAPETPAPPERQARTPTEREKEPARKPETVRTRKKAPPPRRQPPPKKEPPREDLTAIKRERIDTLRTLQDQEYVAEKKQELLSKKRTERLRNIAETKESHARVPVSEGEVSKALAEYTAMIEALIKENWVYPGVDVQGLEAEVSITVAKSGIVRINEIVRTSGNRLFDRSALKAIQKAGQLPPPPFGEDEIVLTFIPEMK
jgi:colicin import membrane protein